MLASLWRIVANVTLTDLLVLIFGLLVLLYVLGTWTYDFFERQGVPSTRPRLPFLGDLGPALIRYKSVPDAIHDVYEQGEGHGIYGIFEFTKPIFMIRDNEILKLVAVKEFDHFVNRRSPDVEKVDPLLSKNLIALKDQKWRDMRATLSPAFTSSKMRNMFPLICQCGEQMAEYLRDTYHTNAQGVKKLLSTDMKDLYTRLANDVIATTAFGVSVDSLKQPNNEFYRMGKSFTDFSGLRCLAFALALCFPKLAEILKLKILDPKMEGYFNCLVHETIKKREKDNIFRPDLLQLLMQAKRGKLNIEAGDEHEAETITSNKSTLSDDDITAQAVVFFLAGFEAISTAICFATHLLSTHSDVQDRLIAEVDEVMKRRDGKLTYEDLQGMKYLDMVVSETLRAQAPSTHTDRICREGITLPATDKSPSITLQPGDIVCIPIRGIHYDPEYWPEPKKFDPERFSDENKHKIKPYTYLPFGIGPRFCIGQRFAIMEVKLALVYTLAHFKLRPSSKMHYPLKFKTGLNIIFEGGFWCDLELRNSS